MTGGPQPADPFLLATVNAWNALRPFLVQEQCRTCECLQGALTELRLALEDLPVTVDQAWLLQSVEGALLRDAPHSCLGCDPCEPGNILAAFYRAQSAATQTGRCACGSSCSGETRAY